MFRVANRLMPVLFLFGVAGCLEEPSSADSKGKPAVPVEDGATLQGLDAQEREVYFHTAEGSELYPVVWIKALDSSKTNEPFLQDPERFGFIPDPDNADGLPIGLTSHKSRGVEFLGEMVGINCAACHVGKITYKDQEKLILGAPNLFDLNGFYLELFQSAGDTAKDPKRLAEFLERIGKEGGVAAEDKARQAAGLLLQFAESKTGELEGAERELAMKAQSLIDKVGRDLQGNLDAASTPQGRAALRKQIASRFEGDLEGVADAMKKAGHVADKLRDLKVNPDQVKQAVMDVAINAKLIKARLIFLKKLQKLHETTRPEGGPGRIDAFGSIRDLVLPEKDNIDANAPVSYPHLWQVNQTDWLHWDGNTNSLMQRNVGQSLGLGAVYDPETFSSTVLPRELYRLEVLTRKIEPPVWPTEMLGAISQSKAERGAALFRDNCARCHSSLNEPQVAKREVEVPLDEIGTDPRRARNVQINIDRKPDGSGGTPFIQGLETVAARFTQVAYKDNKVTPAEQAKMDLPPDKVKWRTTGAYIGRPLVAAWATAPYLHNGSVPTIYDLLKPPAQRPRTFPLGHREYDPVHLGYVTDPQKIPADQRGRFPDFDATLEGNLNIGHDYGTGLPEDDKLAILEYLKLSEEQKETLLAKLPRP